MHSNIPILRFGKPSGPLLQLKAAFFSDNNTLQANVERICAIYAEQPARENCKNCTHPLRGIAFAKLGVQYIQCERCGHLNGAHEDTDEFCSIVYVEQGGTAYAQTYSAADREAYDKRVDAIYKPKAKFLREVLRAVGENFETLSFADLGAGSGYFVSALLKEGATKVVGYEVSERQLRLARQMVVCGEFQQHSLGDVDKIARTAEADVFSTIGVLEHVRHPRQVFSAICSNMRAKYLYISVPMFSLSVYLEAVSPTIFHRQLGAGHTHLYTESSLNWICEEFGFERVGEWWFGTDVVDLFRHIAVKLEKHKDTRELVEGWSGAFTGLIDSLQLQIDNRKLSSEVHMLLRRRT